METDNAKIALDYGIRVGETDSLNFPINFDAVVISHAHLDHSGNLLKLSRGNPVIIGSKMTLEVTSDLLRDMVKIQKSNFNHFPYDNRDVNKITKNWWVQEHVALPGMRVDLYPAGHVAGARMININAEGKTVLYTGDFCL